MRGQLGTLLPRQAGRQRSASRPGSRPRPAEGPGNRAAALHYAAWDWPLTPNTALPATADLEQVFAAWTRLPDAPILTVCGVAFDVIETDAASARAALARLDRLGVPVGPVALGGVGSSGSAGAVGSRGIGANTDGPTARGPASRASADAGPSRAAFLVRAGSAAALSPLIVPRQGPGTVLTKAGEHFELPSSVHPASPRAGLGSAGPDRRWLRVPETARPSFPAAHVVLGALALVPYHALATASFTR